MAFLSYFLAEIAYNFFAVVLLLNVNRLKICLTYKISALKFDFSLKVLESAP